MKSRILFQLFAAFAKIGLFTFGGGYAMLAMIEHHCVEEKGWLTHDEMMSITVIAQSTPGPIAINCATFVGQRQAGFWGAVAATVGLVLPSFVIIYLLAGLLDGLLEIAVVANAFRGIKIAVGLLIADAGLTMLRKMPPKAFPRIVSFAALGIMLAASLLSVRISSVALLLAAACAGLWASKGGKAA